MSTDVNMSLEEIIYKKRRNKKTSLTKKKTATMYSPVDARNKIISKRRNQFTDAREKLMQKAKQKDARLKLQQLREKKIAINHNKIMNKRMPIRLIRESLRSWPRRDPMFTDISRQVSVKQALPHIKRQLNKKNDLKGFITSRNVKTCAFEYEMPMKPLIRTVNNDVMIVDKDEFEPRKIITLEHNPMTNFKIVTHNPNIQERQLNRRTYQHEKEKSPQRLPSILKKRPMAALRSEGKLENFDDSIGYRIIVSNLSNIVTSTDIQELFGGIGGLKESRLVRTGTAEVIYKKLEDAQKAVELYHNRQLDGQPMNCLLVNPYPVARGCGLPASSSSNVEPDLSTFHKVLFSHL